LLAVAEEHWGKRVGTLLLAGALMQAHAEAKSERCVLHVAGGKDNVAASRLYERFGFVEFPETVWERPNKNLWCLGNIGMVLSTLPLSRRPTPAGETQRITSDESKERERGKLAIGP